MTIDPPTPDPFLDALDSAFGEYARAPEAAKPYLALSLACACPGLVAEVRQLRALVASLLRDADDRRRIADALTSESERLGMYEKKETNDGTG